MNAGYIEVESVPDMICCECQCPEDSTTMRYIWAEDEGRVKAYCADHYRAGMVALHGEETVKLLEETGDYHDMLMREGDE